jgi:hypothetical protein
LGIPTDSGFRSSVLFCHLNINCVSDYFFKRNNIIRQTNDKTTLLYYWGLAGLPLDAIISEALHNIIAFNQFLNVFYLLIRDQFGIGTLVPIGHMNTPSFTPIKYNFIDLFKAAMTNEDQLDVIREFYRLTAPNSASFSRVKQDPLNPNVVIQGRHVHQAIMFTNDFGSSGPVGATGALAPISNYSKYDTSRYDDFTFDFEDAMTSECPPPQCPKCPYLVPVNPLKNINPEVKLGQSIIDCETVIEKPCDDVDPGKAIPVYDNNRIFIGQPYDNTKPGPIYAPFGFGYRRCAGELFSYFCTVKLFDRFKDVEFLFDPSVQTPLVTVAPFTQVPDNVFVKPYTGTCC